MLMAFFDFRRALLLFAFSPFAFHAAFAFFSMLPLFQPLFAASAAAFDFAFFHAAAYFHAADIFMRATLATR